MTLDHQGETRVDRLTIKANWEHCNLSAYHAVTLFYHAFIAVYGTLLLALSIGEVSVGDAIPIIAAGLGYNIYAWAWRYQATERSKERLFKYTSANGVGSFTAIALNVFTLFYMCHELRDNQNDFALSNLETGGHMTPQFRKLMHVHLAEQNSKIGSAMVRQFTINAYPMLLLRVFEFKVF